MSDALPHVYSKPASIHVVRIRTAQNMGPRQIPTNTRVRTCALADARQTQGTILHDYMEDKGGFQASAYDTKAQEHTRTPCND